MKRSLVLVLAGLVLGGGAVRGADAPRLKIAVIPKGTTHVFWKSVEAGARTAGQELGIEILWKGPLKENDRAQQIAIVEQFVTEGVAGIVLAPLDDTALKRPVAMAMARNIPVVIFDSALKGEAGKDFVSLVATDNRKGGFMGGEKLGALLDGKGKVSLLRYQVGSASTDERETGFLGAIAKQPGLSILVDNRYAGATMGEAKTAAMNMIDKLRDSDGVFAPNESSTFGLLLALRQNNLAGKIRFVGFDTSPVLLDALRKGDIQALVAQDPQKMGYLGVKTLVAHLQGRKVEPLVDTGVALVTPENIDTPEIQKVIQLP
jgi:ribose transport system substrate-binding protein